MRALPLSRGEARWVGGGSGGDGGGGAGDGGWREAGSDTENPSKFHDPPRSAPGPEALPLLSAPLLPSQKEAKDNRGRSLGVPSAACAVERGNFGPLLELPTRLDGGPYRFWSSCFPRPLKARKA